MHNRIIALIVLIIVCVVIYFARENFLDFVNTYAVAAVTSEIVSTLNDATTQALTKNETYGTYDDFVDIQRATNGDIVNININMLLINLFICDVCEFTQNNLNAICENMELSVPANAFTGIMLLAQMGKNIPIEIMPIGSIDCQFRSNFESVGINQTIHSMYVDIYADVRMLLPLYAKDVKFKTSLIIFENMIIGKVPQVYFGANNKI